MMREAAVHQRLAGAHGDLPEIKLKPGVGEGLSDQVMIAHGGFIRVNANESGGSVFSLTF